MTKIFEHIPVLLEEAITGLNVKENGVYVDCTFGLGGYSRKILSLNKNCKVFGIDKDPDALKVAKKLEDEFPKRFKFLEGDFCDIKDLLNSQNIEKFDGIVFDLGVSSLQIDNPEKGFSFSVEAPLDMRMSKKGISAYDVINTFEEAELCDIIRKYSEELKAKKIAKDIVKAREKMELKTTFDLRKIIVDVANPKYLNSTLARVFQAFRIYVNDELGALNKALESSKDLLNIGGRLSVVSFHSLEDRIVKNFILSNTDSKTISRYLPDENKQGIFKKITNKPITPTKDELEKNPRSRSSKLRVAERKN